VRTLLVLALLTGCGGAIEPPAPVPTEPAELHGFLAAGEYQAWRSEPDLKPGLNSTMHRVFLREDAAIDGSPVGAAAVRELWDADGAEQLAWSAVVKVDPGEGPESWFFYETYDFDDREAHLVAEVAANGCASCHAAEVDVIRTEY